MAKAIEDALAALQYKDTNKTTQPTPAPAATATPQYTIPQTGDTSNPAKSRTRCGIALLRRAVSSDMTAFPDLRI